MFLKKNGILGVFHYQSLHKSSFYYDKHDGRELKESDNYTDKLVRLPVFYELQEIQQKFIIEIINQFYES